MGRLRPDGLILIMAMVMASVGSAGPPEVMSVGAMGDGSPIAPDVTVLWDQPLSSVDTITYANQDFETANDMYDIAIADDFAFDWDEWHITEISVTGNTWNPGTDLSCAVALDFFIFDDVGGIPAGHPWGGAPPVWTLSVPPTDTRITLTTGTGGFLTNVTLSLAPPVVLPPGHYWLVFVPEMEFATCGQAGRQRSETTNLHDAVVINFGGGLGYPTTWTPVTHSSTWGLDTGDFAFRLDGTAVPTGPRVALATPDSQYTVEHDHLADTLAVLGFSPFDVANVHEACSCGAMALIVYAGGSQGGPGIDPPDLQAWVNSGHGLIQVGDWNDYFPNQWQGQLPDPTWVEVTLHNAWHPVVQGVTTTWYGRGFFHYDWPDGALGNTINCCGEVDLAHGEAVGFDPRDFVIAAQDHDPPVRLGRAVYFGINTYGPDAGPNEAQLLANALDWITADQHIFSDGFDSGSSAQWSASSP